MKFISKNLLILALLISSFSALQAQRGGGRNADPQVMADRQTTVMTDSLSLSDAQKAKIAQVNLDYSKKMMDIRKAARENTSGDRSDIRAQMQTLRTEHKENLKKYLTSEQYEKWGQVEANRQERRRGNRPRGDRREKKKNKKKKESSSEIN